MYKQLLFVSTLSLGLAVAPAAMAKPKQDHHLHDQGRDRVIVIEHRDVRGHDDRRSRYDRDDRRDDRSWKAQARERQWHEARYRVAKYQAPRGYVHRNWRAGERLPTGYRGSRYVVHDYHSYRLRTPPRDHQWIRVDHDVVLTAIATGVVAAVVYNIFQ